MFCVCFVKTEDNYNDITRNNLMYAYTQMGSPRFRPERYIGTSIHEAMSMAADDPNNKHDTCAVIVEGFIHVGFRNQLTNFLNSDEYNGEVLIGHILDRGDEYYELHPQTFVVSLKWWDSIGRPILMPGENQEFVANEPIRSEENHHDEYTPLWVAPGNTPRTYTNTRIGWNWIKAALDGGHTIKSFNKLVRSSKRFMYHRGPGKYLNLGAVTSSFKSGYYCYNTEPLAHEPEHELDTLFTPAAGPMPWVLAKNKRLKKGAHVIVYDTSFMALDMTYKVHQKFDGSNYDQVIQEITDSMPSFADSFLINKDDSWSGDDEFKAWFEEYVPTYTFHFMRLDMYDYGHLKETVDGNANSYFHCTNVYEFLSTSQLFDPLTRAIYIDHVIDLFDSNGVSHNLHGVADRLRVAYEAFNPK